MEKLLVTYALLGYLKETSLSKAPIIELYVPIVKKRYESTLWKIILRSIKDDPLSSYQKK